VTSNPLQAGSTIPSYINVVGLNFGVGATLQFSCAGDGTNGPTCSGSDLNLVSYLAQDSVHVNASITATLNAAGNYLVQVISDGSTGFGFAAGGTGNSAASNPLGSVLVLPVPPPNLTITSEGQVLPAGACAHITADPRMPNLAFSLSPSTSTPLSGYANWSLSVQYNRSDGTVDQVAYGQGVQLLATSTWTPQFASTLQGGTATVTWIYGALPSFSSNFCVDGLNPTQGVASAYAGAINSYWDIPKLIATESSWLQFSNGQPNSNGGSQPGFGLMQLTNPKATASQIWNWQQNVVAGLSLFGTKQAGGNAFWQIQQQNYQAYLQNHGGIGPPPPANDIEGYCTFSYSPDGTSTHSFADAIVLKRYNSVGNGEYLVFNNGTWTPSPLALNGTNYVAAVCSHADHY
jgi:hypothetical protein